MLRIGTWVDHIKKVVISKATLITGFKQYKDATVTWALSQVYFILF